MRLCCQCPRPPAGRLEAIRTARLTAVSVAAAVLGALALPVAAPPASAKTACWKQIIDASTNTEHVSSTYPLHCYGEASNPVPEDLAVYAGILAELAAAPRP